MADEPEPTALRRSDARRNRERILQAANDIFGRLGVDAQMTDVANAARVGVATVYRNFDTKEALVNALLEARFARTLEVAREAARQQDAWEGLVSYIKWGTSLQSENRALSQFIAGHIKGSPDLRQQRMALYEILDALTQRAKDEGYLRRDVQLSDLRVMMLAIALAHGSGYPERLARRLTSIMIDGLRAPGHETLEGPPFTTDELERALRVGCEEAAEDDQTQAFKRGRRPWPV